MTQSKHVGSSLDSFLEAEGIKETVHQAALAQLSRTPVRFKDIPAGSTFSGVFGGSKSTAKKLSETSCLVKKVNPQGRDVILTINPDLNEDEFQVVSST